MNVVLLHDARELPHDVYAALTEAGHVVATHGTEPEAIGTFVSAIKWPADAFVVDFRGRAERALRTVGWLVGSPPWRERPLVLAFVPAEMREEATGIAPRAFLVEDAEGVVAGISPRA